MSALVGIFPLILTILLGLGTLTFAVRNAGKAEMACEKVVVSAQKKNLIHLEKMLKLNPQAKALRRSRILAQSQLRAAVISGQPLAIASARARLSTVTRAQLILRAQQQSLLQNSQMITQGAKHSFLNYSANSGVTQSQLTQRPPQGLALRATPISSLTPNHEVPNHFEQSQMITLSWRQDLLHGAPRWLTQWFGPHAFRKKQCSATLKLKESFLWSVHLSRGR